MGSGYMDKDRLNKKQAEKKQKSATMYNHRTHNSLTERLKKRHFIMKYWTKKAFDHNKNENKWIENGSTCLLAHVVGVREETHSVYFSLVCF
jgi:hypothetical protein